MEFDRLLRSGSAPTKRELHLEFLRSRCRSLLAPALVVSVADPGLAKGGVAIDIPSRLRRQTSSRGIGVMCWLEDDQRVMQSRSIRMIWTSRYGRCLSNARF